VTKSNQSALKGRDPTHQSHTCCAGNHVSRGRMTIPEGPRRSATRCETRKRCGSPGGSPSQSMHSVLRPSHHHRPPAATLRRAQGNLGAARQSQSSIFSVEPNEFEAPARFAGGAGVRLLCVPSFVCEPQAHITVGGIPGKVSRSLAVGQLPPLV